MSQDQALPAGKTQRAWQWDWLSPQGLFKDSPNCILQARWVLFMCLKASWCCPQIASHDSVPSRPNMGKRRTSGSSAPAKAKSQKTGTELPAVPAHSLAMPHLRLFEAWLCPSRKKQGPLCNNAFVGRTWLCCAQQGVVLREEVLKRDSLDAVITKALEDKELAFTCRPMFNFNFISPVYTKLC